MPAKKILKARSRRAARVIPVGVAIDAAQQRRLLADYLRLCAWWLGRPPVPKLPPRLEQTLIALLQGDAEKQVAARRGVTVHTVHDNVKDLYRRLNVSSRGELMARFLPSRIEATDRSPANGGSPNRVIA